MGGKSGGGYDAGPMLEYGDKALALQEQMYNDSVNRSAPWYDTGSDAVTQLRTLMGLGGTGSSNAQSRQALIDQYSPQFTTQSTGGFVYDNQGRAYGTDSLAGMAEGRYSSLPPEIQAMLDFKQGQNGPETFLRSGIGQTSSTDTAGLNSYVDNLIAQQQGEAQSNPLFGSLTQKFGMDQFEADPGYQFRLDEGTKALERAAAARGQYFDPSTMKALAENNSSMADQTYNQSYDRYNLDQNNLFNRLASLSGMGQTATGQISSAGQNYANQAGNIYGQQANAITSAQVAKDSQPSMFDSIMGLAGQGLAGWASGGFASDIRLKQDIVPMGYDNGFPIYEFSYKGEDKRYIGVMAQDVEKTHPEAVMTRDDGMKMVNYDMIGVSMREVN